MQHEHSSLYSSSQQSESSSNVGVVSGLLGMWGIYGNGWDRSFTSGVYFGTSSEVGFLGKFPGAGAAGVEHIHEHEHEHEHIHEHIHEAIQECELELDHIHGHFTNTFTSTSMNMNIITA